MKQVHEIDFELQKQNYERELELCQKAGGDVERYRRLSFDAFQLEQIRLGLENGIDVEDYVDPNLSWIEMENIRITKESGIDMSEYKKAGFTLMQQNEIRIGLQEHLDVSKYAKKEFLAPQMKQLRKGIEKKLDISIYSDPDLDRMQMREIRLGLEKGLDVSKYADKKYKYLIMRAFRLALEEGYDIEDYVKRGYNGKVLLEITKAIKNGFDISVYVEEGYVAEQLEQINIAREKNVDLIPYLSKDFHGAQLSQIIKGLEKQIDVSIYAKKEYNWFQMREIRFGLEDKIDVKAYLNPDFHWKQMAEIRKGLIFGIDVTDYAKIYYEPEQMADMREVIRQNTEMLDADMENLLSDSIKNDLDNKYKDEIKEGNDDSQDMLFDSCISVEDDKMTAYLCLEPIMNMKKQLTVPDIMRLLRHHDVVQGVKREVIYDYLNKKDYKKKVVIAEGKKAEDGDDGKFIYHFRKEVKAKPKILRDGSVDYKNMDLFEVVKKGQLIAEYVPSTTGVFGYDITGKLIAPRRGKELVPLRGKGFILSEDRKKYYSDLDGVIEFFEEEGKIEIRNIYVVSGNVDISTGNINFNGDVNVMGNVEKDFIVNATGNIVINGSCEGGTIIAGKDIIIHKGCQGQETGILHADGSITGNFFESVKIEAGEDVVASYLLNCDIKVGGQLRVEGRKGLILGGHICAKQGVVCFGIGNIAEINTIIEVGVGKEELREYQDLLKQIEKVSSDISSCEEGLEKLMALPERNEQVTALCDRLTKAIYSEKVQKKKLLEKREESMKRITIQKSARITVRGNIYPGTKIFMNADPYIVQEAMTGVEFVKKETKIDVVK